MTTTTAMSALANVMITVLLVCSMTAMGLDLTRERLAGALRSPVAYGLALLANTVLLPLLSWLMTSTLEADPRVAAALLLCAASPGGGTGALMVRLSRADAGMGSALMLGMSLAATVTAPSVAALVTTGDVDRTTLGLRMLGSLVTFQLIPLAIAAAVRWRFAEVAIRLQRVVSTTGTVLLLAIVGVLMSQQGKSTTQFAPQAWGLIVAHVVMSMAIALLFRRETAAAVFMVSAVRSLSTALMLASVGFPDPLVTTSILAYGMVMYLSTLAAAPLLRRAITEPAVSPSP